MIESHVIEKIAEKIRESGLDGSITASLREQWPDIHFTYCSDDDVHHANPVYGNGDFFIYLVDSSDHCIHFTSSYESATGVVIAECEDE